MVEAAGIELKDEKIMLVTGVYNGARKPLATDKCLWN